MTERVEREARLESSNGPDSSAPASAPSLPPERLTEIEANRLKAIADWELAQPEGSEHGIRIGVAVNETLIAVSKALHEDMPDLRAELDRVTAENERIHGLYDALVDGLREGSNMVIAAKIDTLTDEERQEIERHAMSKAWSEMVDDRNPTNSDYEFVDRLIGHALAALKEVLTQ